MDELNRCITRPLLDDAMVISTKTSGLDINDGEPNIAQCPIA